MNGELEEERKPLMLSGEGVYFMAESVISPLERNSRDYYLPADVARNLRENIVNSLRRLEMK